MATAIEVICITKTNRSSEHERISHIGGSTWQRTLTDAIADIGDGVYDYYVQYGSGRAKVIVATSASGRRYLRTDPDATRTDNLLSLPECH